MARKAKKYSLPMMFRALRLFAKARNEALAGGFTDNGGAIHSAERVVDMMGTMIRYPALAHQNSIKKAADAECTVAAYEARQRGDPVFIEHVMPRRAFTRAIIEMIDDAKTNEEIEAHMRQHFRLVLTTKAEAKIINKLNRSNLSPDRIAEAGLAIHRL